MKKKSNPAASEAIAEKISTPKKTTLNKNGKVNGKTESCNHKL